MKLLLPLWLAAAPAWAIWGPLVDPLSEPKRLYEAGNYPQVIARLGPDSLQRLRSRDLRRAYFYLGSSYERTSQADRAVGVYELGVKLYPKDINLLTRLAGLLHRMGLEEQAQPLFQRVLTIHPNNAQAHLGLAEIDRSLGFLERSAEHYERVLEAWPENAGIWRDYAEVLLEQRETKTAELAIRKALALSPEAESAVDLALILRAAGRLEEALEILNSLNSLEGTGGPELSLARALWLLEAGRLEEAKALAERVLKADPADPLGRWLRARLLLKAGRASEALKDLEAAASSREAPFVARVSAAMMKRLKEQE